MATRVGLKKIFRPTSARKYRSYVPNLVKIGP